MILDMTVYFLSVQAVHMGDKRSPMIFKSDKKVTVIDFLKFNIHKIVKKQYISVIVLESIF